MPVVSYAQPQILQGTTNVTDSTITSCGSSSITLTTNSTATALIWSTQKLSVSPGAGSLSPTTGTGSSQTFTPTVSGVDAYTITLSDGTNSSSVTLVFGPIPDIAALNIPSSLCENGGAQQLTSTLGTSQTLTASSGTLGGSGSIVTLDPQGLANNTPITLTLKETYAVPGSTTSFHCESTTQITSYAASNTTLNLGTSSFQKCSSPVTLSGGVPSGGTYSISSYPNAINSSNQIDPSQLPVGNHTVVYTHTNSNGCTNTASQTIDITGFVLTGSGVNLAVSEVTSSGLSPILASSFNGITTYSICSGSANATFQLTPLSGLSNFPSYSINWGDGSAVQSGTYSSTNVISHQYNTAGLYTVTLQLTTTSGCTIDTTINLYFGSTQTLGLSTPGNTTVCLAPGQDSVFFDFEISNWQNDPDGISYTFNSNDGSSKSAVSPLVNGGVSQYPFIIYDASNQKAYYRHFFVGSSCNFTSSLGGTTYNNTYSVSATKTAPCPGSQSTAAVGPIVISESPEADIIGADSVCTNSNYLIQDISGAGQMVVANGNDFTCDPSANGYWEIYDAQWNLLTLPNNLFSLNTGSSLGTGGVFPTLPAFWTSGSNNLSIQFLQSGTFHVIKHIGLTAFGGNTLCTIDSDTISVCVDTIPIANLIAPINDTICVGDQTLSALLQDSINCNSPTTYSLFVFDESNVLIFNSASSTDTNFNWTPNISGKMTLRYGVSNQCGVSYTYDTIIVIDEPNVSFPPNDSIYCADTLLVNLGSPPFSVISTSQYTAADSVYYFITPQSGWTSLGLNQFGHDSLILWDNKNYTIHARAYNDCGSQVLSTQIQLDSIPNPYFTLTDTTGCSPFSPSVNSFFHNNGKSHTWKIYLSGMLQEEVSGINPSFSSYTTTSVNITYTIWHIVESTNGCIDSTSILFHVVPNPDADFSISAAACAPWTPTITNNSVGNILSYDWDISPVNSLVSLSDTSNTTPTLAFAGLQYPDSDQQYTLSLLTTSDSGCTDTYSETITLYARPLADFSLSNDSSCGPFTLSPTESSGSNGTINAWQWTVIDSANATTLASSSLQNPAFNLPASNNGVITYLIQLIVQDNRGCSDTTTTSFYINPTPTAAFTLASNTCTGTNINTLITNNSSANDNSNNQLTYAWTIDSAGTTFNYNDSIPFHILLNNSNTTITYTVTLTVTNQYNCSNTSSTTIDVYPNAIAQLSDPGPLTDCAPFTIDNNLLAATSFTGNNSYTWTIIDSASGNTITSFSGINALNYTIQSPEDTVWIVLTVTSAYGCLDDIDSVLAYTLQDPNPSWALDTLQGCAPFTPIIDNVVATDPTLTHSWVVYDAAGATVATLSGPNPTLPALSNNSNTNNLTYTITHTVTAGTSGCEDDTTITVTVLPNPDADFSISAAACAPWTPTITNNSVGNILSYDWDISPVNSLVSLSDTSNTTPTLAFAGLQYPDSDQQYTLSLLTTSDSGCTDTYSETITLYARPLADFSLSNDSSCGPFTLSPTESSGSNGTINAWQWTVIDSANATTLASSSLQNPAFNLPASNNGVITYLIQLIVQDNRGCSDTTTTSFYINPTPTAAFTLASNTCTGTNINTLITNNSSANDNSNNQLTYAWTIDSAGTTFNYNDSIPFHILLNNSNTTITYTVTLTVTNQYNCSNTSSTTIDVYPNAIAQLSDPGPLTDCAPFTIDNNLLAATSFTGNNSYTWTIIDSASGNTITSFSGINALNYTIQSPEDTVWIVLTVTSAYGCLDDIDSVLAYTLQDPNPSWALDTLQGCAPFTPIIDNVVATDPTLTHSWVVYDAAGATVATLSGPNPTLPALSNNSNTNNLTYTITHTVTAGTSGCEDDTTITVTVLPNPDADFSISAAACAPWTPTITNNSVGNILSYDWDISPVNSLVSLSDTSNTTPTLAFAGLQYPDSDQQYTLSLLTTSDSGCTDTYSETITLYARPLADFSLSNDSSCGPFTLSPTESSGSNGTINAWQWTVIDSANATTLASSSLQNPAFNLPASNNGVITYLIQLIVQDNRGCSDTTTTSFYINPTPTAAFTLASNTCTGTNINTLITNNSSANDNSNNQLTYAWTIDSAGTTFNYNDSIPFHILLNNSNTTITYTVTLTVTNQYNCSNTSSTTIDVYPNAIAQLSDPGPLTDCAPFTIDNNLLAATSFTGNNSYTWTIIDSASGNTITSFSGINALNYTIQSPEDTVWIVLTVTSAYGCLDDIDSVLAYTLQDPNPSWALDTLQGCAPFTPIIDNVVATDPTLTHSWVVYDAAGATVATLSGPNPTLPALSNNSNTNNLTYTITHTVTAGTSGCEDDTTITVTVLPNPDADFSISAAACAPWTPTITNNSVGNILSYDWDISPVNSLVSLSDTSNTTPTLAFAGLQYPDSDQQYTLSLLTTSDSGCTDTYSETITLYARPLADFSLSNDSSCGPFTLSPTESSGSNGTINAWQWTVIDSANATTLASSSLQNPAFNLPASNNGVITYLIQLIVQDNRGCSDTTTTSFYINPTPTAAFTLASNTCTGTNINTLITNNSSANDNSNNQLTYAWTIDSAGTTFNYNDSIPFHILLNNSNTTITYTVTLTVTNQYNCSNTSSTTIDVYPNAIAQLSDPGPLTDCAPFTIDNNLLAATSFTGNNSYTWTIIDSASGNTITSFSGINALNYTIQSPEDTVWIVLTVTSAYGCLDDIDSVLAYTLQDPNPSWALDTLQGCAPFTPIIDNVVATDPTLTHSWVVYDAAGATVATLSGPNPTLPALSNNSNTNNLTYTITHTVTAGTSGCEDDTTITVTVLPNPDADFSISAAACAPWTPTITNNSVGNILSYDWDISPVNSLVSLSDTSNTTPTLAFAGLQYPDSDQQYTLSLLTTSDSGCTDTYSETITLYARPLADFSLSNDSSCGPFTLSPTESSGSNGTINAWQWTVIDSANATTLASSSLQNPAFNLPASNNGVITYLIQLIVQDNRGCSDTTTTSFYINPTPTAAFTLASNTCTGTNINTLITNNSSANDNSNNQLTYAWTIDSAGTTFNYNDSIPFHILLNNSNTTITYTVTLTVTNQYNCSNTSSTTIDVYPNAIAQLSDPGPLTDCAPFTIDNNLLAATSFTGNNSYTWTIIDSASGNTITSFSGINALNYTIQSPEDTVWIVLTVTSAYGCLDDIDSVLAYTLQDPNPSWALDTLQGCAHLHPLSIT